MGQDYTPKYVVEIIEIPPPGKTNIVKNSRQEWKTKARYGIPGYGKPNDENLEKFVMTYAQSLKPGGANEHISRELGYMPFPNKAIIRENYPGAPPIATWKAAMFQVF